MNQAKQLYHFLTACGGNWRNSIYIKCQDEDQNCLLAADRDGQPIIMSVQKFYQLTGVWIDPLECCGHLTEAGFESLYAQYLLWRCASAEEHPLRRLAQETPLSCKDPE